MSEKDELNNELSEKGSELSTWRQLTESIGWKMLKTVMEAQRLTRMEQAMGKPLTSADEVYEQEFTKGEAAGIGLALTFAYTQIEQLTNELEAIQTQLTEADDYDQADAQAVPRSRVDDEHFYSGDKPNTGGN